MATAKCKILAILLMQLTVGGLAIASTPAADRPPPDKTQDVLRLVRSRMVSVEKAKSGAHSDEGALDGLALPPELTGAALPSTSGLESMLLDGLTIFAMNRARDELIAFATDTLTDTLCRRDEPAAAGGQAKDVPAQLYQLFPSVCELVNKAKSANAVVDIGRMFQSALVDDLHSLPLHTAEFLTKQVKPSSLFTNISTCVLTLGDDVFKGVAQHRPPLGVLVKAAGKDLLAKKSPCDQALDALGVTTKVNAVAAEGALELLNAGLEDAASGGQTGKEKLATYLANPDALIEELRKRVLSTSSSDNQTLMAAIEQLAPLVVTVYKSAAALQSMDLAHRDTALKAVVADSLALLEALIQTALALPAEQDRQVDEKRQAVAKVLVLLKGSTQMLRGNYAAGIAALVPTMEALLPDKTFAALVKISSLVVDLGAAKNGDEVATALNKVAAPVGSWRQRRQHRVINLSAQFGVHGSLEWPLGSGPPGSTVGALQTGALFGLHVPLGIDISTPLGSSCTLGLMAQIIDVGALATARLADVTGSGMSAGQASQQPKYGFLQVLAPGAEVFLGLGKTPLILAAHFAYIPQLRPALVSAGAPEDNRSVLQLGISLAVDIPIVSLHSW